MLSRSLLGIPVFVTGMICMDYLLADTGAETQAEFAIKDLTPRTILLNTNRIANIDNPTTVIVVWNFVDSKKNCTEGRLNVAEKAAYCIEINKEYKPYRCVITTPRILNHTLLGHAIQECFQ